MNKTVANLQIWGTWVAFNQIVYLEIIADSHAAVRNNRDPEYTFPSSQ